MLINQTKNECRRSNASTPNFRRSYFVVRPTNSARLEYQEIRMEVARFDDIQAEFTDRVSQVVYGILTTVDRQNRPRSRVMHPIWEQHIGWVISWPASHKAKHLEHNPAVSL